jgi:hypothetical protein
LAVLRICTGATLFNTARLGKIGRSSWRISLIPSE